jgi:hypothetical protein
MRLSQAANFEPLVDDLGNAWQRDNSRVEIYVLNEWTMPKPGIKEQAQPPAAPSVHEVSTPVPGDHHAEPEHH